MIKPSRRAIFRSVFGRAGFELRLDTANEVLMRVNQSLDPIPLTERMWASYVAARRPLRYSDADHAQAASSADSVADIDAAVSHADFGDLPEHVARDLMLLLRLEALLRRWSASPGSDARPVPSEPHRLQLLADLEQEIVRYVDHGQPADEFPREVIDEVVGCLAKAAGVERPAPPDTASGSNPV